MKVLQLAAVGIAALVLSGCSGSSASRPSLPNVPQPPDVDGGSCQTVAQVMSFPPADRVDWIQQELDTPWPSEGGDPDGVMGPVTRRALVAFQKAHGLKPDGIVGPATIKALVDKQNRDHDAGACAGR
jgi:peptidoglycan hydrolase-like protein with peptidoglycan-binding domain